MLNLPFDPLRRAREVEALVMEGLSMVGRGCKWYEVCPIKRFYEQGKLEKEWIEKYCQGDYQRYVRYWLEEKGEPHPDNLLPNGEVREELR